MTGKVQKDYSLGPERRIKRRSDYLRVQSSKNKVSSRHFLLAYRPRPDVAEPSAAEEQQHRFGVTITTKVDKRAARRNRLRRRLRECYRLIRPRLVSGSFDIAIIARNGACDLSFEKLSREFKYLLYESKLLPGKRQSGEAKSKRQDL